MRIRELKAASEIIDALGGTVEFGVLTGMSKQSVSNSKKNGTLPTDTYAIVTDALRRKGARAPYSLFRMKPPKLGDQRIAS